MENSLKQIVVRYNQLIKYYEELPEDYYGVLGHLNKPETLPYLKLLRIFVGKINELLYDMQQFCSHVINFSDKIAELFNFFLNHVLKDEFRTMAIKDKIQLLTYNRELDAVTLSEGYAKTSVEFEVYLDFVYGKNVALNSINDDKTRTELAENFRTFIIRACWKMVDTLPYGDSFLEDASCLVPTNYEYSKWLRIAKRFERILIDKYHNFTQELDKYEKTQNSIRDLYSNILKKDENQGTVGLYMNQEMRSVYPILSHLAGTILALPHTSVEVERLFSQLKLIKSERRCNLSQTTLESLLMLKTSDINLVEDQKVYESIVSNQIAMHSKLAQVKKDSIEKGIKRKIEDLQKDHIEIISEDDEHKLETFEDMLEKRLKKIKLENEEKIQSKVRHRIYDDEFYL